MIKKLTTAALFTTLLATSALADTIQYESCGQPITIDEAPNRAITLNQQATEVMLALGLEDHMVGTAYLEDEIPAQWQDAYDQVPVIAENYPAKEVVLIEEPDFCLPDLHRPSPRKMLARKRSGLHATLPPIWWTPLAINTIQKTPQSPQRQF